MRTSTNILGVVAVAGLAYAAGSAGLFRAVPVVAAPQEGRRHAEGQHEQEHEHAMMPDMEAAMKLGMPGEHHRYLDQLIGEWEGIFRMWMVPGAPPMEMEGEVTREWILGGRYVREVVTSESEMGAFEGLGFIGYNNFDGQFEIAWLDNMGTQMYFETATYDPETKILSTRGSQRDPATGHVAAGWGTVDMSSPGRHTYEAYKVGPDGKPYKAFEGVLERK